MTFGVIGSSFFGNVSNCWLNSYGCEKPEGGGRITAPSAVRGLNYVICIFEVFLKLFAMWEV